MIEATSLNLAHMYSLGTNLENNLQEPSLLAKFRVHRLRENTLDEINTEIIRQCVEKGIINNNEFQFMQLILR